MDEDSYTYKRCKGAINVDGDSSTYKRCYGAINVDGDSSTYKRCEGAAAGSDDDPADPCEETGRLHGTRHRPR